MLSLRILQRAYGASHLDLFHYLSSSYRPLGVKFYHMVVHASLKEGQIVHGYLDKNEKPKKTKFEGKTSGSEHWRKARLAGIRPVPAS